MLWGKKAFFNFLAFSFFGSGEFALQYSMLIEAALSSEIIITKITHS